MSDAQNPKVENAEAWNDYCELLKKAGEVIVRDELDPALVRSRGSSESSTPDCALTHAPAARPRPERKTCARKPEISLRNRASAWHA